MHASLQPQRPWKLRLSLLAVMFARLENRVYFLFAGLNLL